VSGHDRAAEAPASKPPMTSLPPTAREAQRPVSDATPGPAAHEPEEKPDGWAWTLFTGMRESAVEVWRDGELKLTLPLTADQAELLMGRQVTLAGELERDGFVATEDGSLAIDAQEPQPAPELNGGNPVQWSDACAPGGMVCAVPSPSRPDGICGMPVESEPCGEPHAADGPVSPAGPELPRGQRAEPKAAGPLLGLLDDFTHAVIDLDDGARLVGIDRIASAARSVRKKAGLPELPS
jgi:hypothetical protein